MFSMASNTTPFSSKAVKFRNERQRLLAFEVSPRAVAVAMSCCSEISLLGAS